MQYFGLSSANETQQAIVRLNNELSQYLMLSNMNDSMTMAYGIGMHY